MFCKNCGKDIKDSKFCPYCGEKGVDETNEVNAEEKNQENTAPSERDSNHAKSKKGIIAGGAVALVIVVIVGTVFLTKNRNVSDEKEVEVSEAIEETTQNVEEPEEEETDVADEESEVVEEEETDVEEEETNEDKAESQVLETPRIREIKREANSESEVCKFDRDGDLINYERTRMSDGEQVISSFDYTYLLDESGNKIYGLFPDGFYENGGCLVDIKDGPLLSGVTIEFFWGANKQPGGSECCEYIYDDQNRLTSAKNSYISYKTKENAYSQSIKEANLIYDNNIVSYYAKTDYENGFYQEEEWKEKYDSNNRPIEHFDDVFRDSTGSTGESSDVEYAYDNIGRLVSKSDMYDVSKWEYDEEGRLVHSEEPYANQDYEYDESGRILKHYKSGFWTKYYNYDEKNLCVSINLIADNPASNPERVINAKNEGYDPETEFIFTYDDKNRLIKAQMCDILNDEESGPLWSEPYEITIEYDENNLPICIKSSRDDATPREDFEEILRQQYSEEAQNVLFHENYSFSIFDFGNFSYVTD